MGVDPLLAGYKKFLHQEFGLKKKDYEKLEEPHTPSTLFVGCSDSSVSPEVLVHANPGDTMVIRNAGNIIPAFGADLGGPISASLEFAIRGLQVQRIIVCGHYPCLAMDTLLHPEDLEAMSEVESWLQQAEAVKIVVDARYSEATDEERLRKCVENNVLMQLRRLMTYPSVTELAVEGQLEIMGWVLNEPSGALFQYYEREGKFVPVEDELFSVTPFLA